MSVCVIGSINQDEVVRVATIPRPGETVLADGIRRHAGGKGANQAVAAARLGATVALVACVGDDEDGARLLGQLRAEGVDTIDVVTAAGVPTGRALVSVDSRGENSIIVVPGANFALTADHVRRAVARREPGTVVTVQAEVAPAVVVAAAEAAEARGSRLVVNLSPFRHLEAHVLALADPLVLNETEAAELLGRPMAGVDEARAGARALAGRSRSVVVTLGSLGAVWATDDADGVVSPPAVPDVVDTTGAGDAFLGAVCTRLADGAPLGVAVGLGVLAGTMAVTREGAQASYPFRAEVDALAP